MAFSYDSYTGNGSTTVYAISFNYITSTVVVSGSPKGIEVYLDNIKQTSGYTIDTSLNRVTITPAPATGVNIQILRRTPRALGDRLVDFADATILTEAQMDSSAIQLLYIAQEAFEQTDSGGSVNPSYLAYNEVTGEWDAAYSGSETVLGNIKTPTANDHAVNKLYVDNVVEWGISGVPQQWTFTGNGVLTNFLLLNGPYVEEEMLVVAVNGVLKTPNTHFTTEQGATSTNLVFSAAPDDAAAISIQNFGKMRFLDGVSLSDGSVATAKLDQTVGGQAVTTATIRDDAVTDDKIADGSVDLARLDTSTFTTATGDTTPRFLSVPASGVTLALGTLKTEHIEDFNTDIIANINLNDLSPDANWSNGSYQITNLGTPTAGDHATHKTYVDNLVTATVQASGLERISVHTLGVSAGEFEIAAWFSSAYKAYVFHCSDFGLSHASSAVGFQLANAAGTYITSGYSTGGMVHDTAYTSVSTKNGLATAGIELTEYHNFELDMPNNYSPSLDTEIHVISNGAGDCEENCGATLPGFNLNGGTSVYTSYMLSSKVALSGVCSKIKFRCIDNRADTSTSGNILAGARVVVYGRTF